MSGFLREREGEGNARAERHLLVVTTTDMAVFWTMVRMVGKAATQQ